MPDIRTLFLTLFLVNTVLTLMLFTFWRSQKTHDGFRLWMLSLLVTSCGYFLYMLEGAVPAFLCSTVAGLLIMLSVMMRLDSTRMYFQSRALPRITYSILVPGILLLFWFMIIDDSQIMRGVIIGLFIVPCFVATALIAIRSREPETRSLRYSFSAALLVTALLWTMMTVHALITPGDHSLGGPDPINTIFFIVTILMDIVLTASFLMLNMARSQGELKQSEERYRNLADNLPDYVLIHDREFIHYANPAATRLLGPAEGTLAGQSIYSILTPASAEAAREIIDAIRRDEFPDHLSEIDIQLRDGTIRHCLIKTVRIEDAGLPSGLSVITDITERKAAEDALSRANKKLTILSSITRHDIKNQLTALAAYLELSKEELGTSPTASEYLTSEMKIVETMGHQLDFTKVYEDMGTTAPAWQNVNAGIRRAVAALPMREVRVDVDRTDVSVYADPLFEKVFYNLIDNALKYGGEAMTTIRITSEETGAGLVITCEDDGAGIAVGDKARLFERGFGKHTGLGLFLTREILAITGITIAETSGPDNGARFELVVPKGAYRFTGETVPPG
ncbi:PAS domain-containing sensor histidine kinase [Methanoregula sp.]|uniref:PAS domain S-box protein n=1 Tax=Methanoregula sp. TaxID=2052170 RepID=UPI0023757AE5|nr:PAS domain-containing sensor histidine kinase [Methanoregula sp.]MDD1685662.1 PAS domain-containing sensor histidine kinase [Methanoregula sp.]